MLMIYISSKSQFRRPLNTTTTPHSSCPQTPSRTRPARSARGQSQRLHPQLDEPKATHVEQQAIPILEQLELFGSFGLPALLGLAEDGLKLVLHLASHVLGVAAVARE